MPTSPADAAGQERPAVMLSLQDGARGYSGSPVVRGVSAQVGSGEIVTIVGPNGAGKSTLLKAIAGLLRVGSGRVVLGGTDITNQRTSRLARLGLGYVPQSNDVFEPLTVRENLEIGGYRVPPPGGRARIDESTGLLPAPGARNGPRGGGPAAEHPGAAAGAAPGAVPRAGDGAAMSRPLTVAICQLRWSPDPGRNLDQGLAMAVEGFSGGANVVLLPELAVPGYTADPVVLAESAQTLNGPAVKAWQRAAAAGGGSIVGGLCEGDGSPLHDSAVLGARP